MSHTKTPWRLARVHSATCDIDATSNGLDRCIAIDVANENARRIVACVNALNGISTEHLEQYGLPDFAQTISDLRQQRDELRAALIEADSALEIEGYTADGATREAIKNVLNSCK